MRALLDTHAFLWWVTDDPQLSSTSRSIIADSGNISKSQSFFQESDRQYFVT
ncbi:type II toxin-antitoxin system VapC family toxin [Nostoc sp. CALU 546]|uniref:type II toxin-antitoxin system VapC family toxin n=1 Tax=Nostoc sp. CALU 546 TaxID=1867241 RepID=UPI003B67F5CF